MLFGGACPRRWSRDVRTAGTGTFAAKSMPLRSQSPSPGPWLIAVAIPGSETDCQKLWAHPSEALARKKRPIRRSAFPGEATAEEAAHLRGQAAAETLPTFETAKTLWHTPRNREARGVWRRGPTACPAEPRRNRKSGRPRRFGLLPGPCPKPSPRPAPSRRQIPLLAFPCSLITASVDF